jgi:signal transduction histidine kinase
MISYELVRVHLSERRGNIDLQRELGRKERAIKASSDFKANLLAVLLHDLRSPVQSLSGIIDLMREGYFNADDTKHIAAELDNRVRGVSDTINNLLEWFGSGFGEQGLKSQKTDLGQLAHHMIKELEPRFGYKGLSVTTHIPSIKLETDQRLVKVVLRNLLQNASKYSKHGGAIEVSYHTTDHFVFCHVKDYGVGMDDDTIKQIFTQKLTSSVVVDEEKKIGFGLILCLDIIKQLGGKMTAKSKLGHDTTVTFSLPLRVKNKDKKAKSNPVTKSNVAMTGIMV